MVIRALVESTNQRKMFHDLGYVGKKTAKSLNEQDKNRVKYFHRID